MALRKILTEPNKLLREQSLVVKEVDENLQKLMDDMLETMYAAPGIGLAAIQVGVPKRVIILDIGWRDKLESTSDEKYEEKKKPMYFVNPEIILTSKNETTYEEGCLSVPGQFAEINRPKKVSFSFLIGSSFHQYDEAIKLCLNLSKQHNL